MNCEPTYLADQIGGLMVIEDLAPVATLLFCRFSGGIVPPTPQSGYLLLEDGGRILLETGGKIGLE